MFENLDKFLMLFQLFQMFLPESKDNSVDEFKKWLEIHNHNQMVEILNNENQIANYLANLIADKNEDLKKQLADINQMVASILANTKTFAPVASMMNIQSNLSEQAVSILKQFVESGGHDMTPAHTLSERSYILNNGELKYSEERFLDDDLHTLVALGFIREQFDKNGDISYIITRNAVKFIESLPKEEKNG
jgi:DNA-binding phage protein